MSENTSLIYGLDNECRALCSQFNENLLTRFLVGTLTLEASQNQVHLLEYLEDSNAFSKNVFRHKKGEIWHLASFTKQTQLFVSCYSSLNGTGNVINQCSIFRIPVDVSSHLKEVETHAIEDLVEVANFNKETLGVDEKMAKLARIKPEEEDKLLLMLDTKLAHVDVETNNLIEVVTLEQTKTASRSARMTTFSWSPHFNASMVAIATSANIYAKDLRVSASNTSSAWNISQAHSQIVRDIDFNPNSQYYFATSGDDCEVKFWDIRNLSRPALKMFHHSHWVWSVRYNTFHDHLVLTSSSDGNVNLLRAGSISSQPYGCLIDEELEEDETNIKPMAAAKPKAPTGDGLIRSFKDHEDSVYGVEWSPSDPWTFASLSYDGRFIINKVPHNERSQ